MIEQCPCAKCGSKNPVVFDSGFLFVSIGGNKPVPCSGIVCPKCHTGAILPYSKILEGYDMTAPMDCRYKERLVLDKAWFVMNQYNTNLWSKLKPVFDANKKFVCFELVQVVMNDVPLPFKLQVSSDPKKEVDDYMNRLAASAEYNELIRAASVEETMRMADACHDIQDAAEELKKAVDFDLVLH